MLTVITCSALALIIALALLNRDLYAALVYRLKTWRLPARHVDFEIGNAHLWVSVLMALFYLFTQKLLNGLVAFFSSSDLVEFFTLFRGVYSGSSELQNPGKASNIIAGFFLSTAAEYLSIYLLWRGMRTYFQRLNNNYFDKSAAYKLSDAFRYTLFAVLIYSVVDLAFFSQSISTYSQLALIGNLISVKLSPLVMFTSLAHITFLKNPSYTEQINRNFKIHPKVAPTLDSPIRLALLTYGLSLFFRLPFYSGFQFMENNLLLVLSIILSLSIIYLMARMTISRGFSLLSVMMSSSEFEIAMQTAISIDLERLKKHLPKSSRIMRNQQNNRVTSTPLFLRVQGWWMKLNGLQQVLLIASLSLFLVVPKIFLLLLFLSGFLMIVSTFLGIIFHYTVKGLGIIRSQTNGYTFPSPSWQTDKNFFLGSSYSAFQAMLPGLFICLVFFLFISAFPKSLTHDYANFSSALIAGSGDIVYLDKSVENPSIPIANAEVPPSLTQFLILQEDRSFLEQRNWLPNKSNWQGVSLSSFYRALKGQGGSNLNYQLLKNAGLKNAASRDIQRKMAEMISSIQLSLSQEPLEILNLYLNSVPFAGGRGHRGLFMASTQVFGKAPLELNPLECLFLVKSLKWGHQYKTKDLSIPFTKAHYYADILKEDLLQTASYWKNLELLSEADLQKLASYELGFQPSNFQNIGSAGSQAFFRSHWGESGFRGNCTIDLKTQEALEESVKNFQSKHHRVLTEDGFSLNTAALVVDIKSGAILAHYGGSNSSDQTTLGFGNPMASLIKPFIILELLEQGFKAEDLRFYDGPVRGMLTPRNHDRSYSLQDVDLQTVLKKSLNTIVNLRLFTNTVGLFKKVEKRFEMMMIPPDPYLDFDQPQSRAHLETNYPLGSRNMTLLNLAQAYQCLLNAGEAIPLRLIDSVFYSQSGWSKNPKNRQQLQVYSAKHATTIKNALKAPFEDGGTMYHLNSILPSGNVYFGKTGTSSGAKYGYTLLSDGSKLVIVQVSYCVNSEGIWTCNGGPSIPSGSGGHGAGLIAAEFFNLLSKLIKNEGYLAKN